MDKTSIRTMIRAAGITAAIALLAVSISVRARALDLQQRQQFSIPSESLNVALTAFSAQTRLHVLTSRVPGGLSSPGVSGDLSTLNALTALLRGTGMAFRQIDAETLVVVPAETAAKLRPIQFLQLGDVDENALADQPTAASAPAAAAPTGLAEVQVTGTRITTPGYEAPTPLTSVNIADVQAAAPTNIANYVNSLPELADSATPANSTSSITSGTAGENLLNLRNLGATRTLVLVDGQRWVSSDAGGEVDINNIPQGLVRRVDIVTGGASATYGSDAVAGVVNFVLDKSFTGLKGEVSGGETTYGDDATWKLNLTGGTGFADNRGHFLLELDASGNAGILNDPRPYTQRGWKDINNPAYTAINGLPRQIIVPDIGLSNAAPGGIIVSGPLQGVYFGPGGTPYQFNYGPIVSNPFVQGGDWRATDDDSAISLDAQLYHQSLFARASYDLPDDITVFAQYSYGFTHTHGFDTSEYALGGINVSTSNPFLPASVAARAKALGLSTLTIGTTYADIPRFGSSNYRTVNRYVLGGNGSFKAFGTLWTWDTYVTFGNSYALSTANVTHNSNLADASQAVLGPNGSIICASTLTNPGNGCVPFNLFGTGVNSQAAVAYVEGESHLDQTYQQTAGAVDLQGEPFSDWAGPVSLAIGVDGRRESATGVSGPEEIAANFFAGNYNPTIGHYQVWEGYAETAVPLAKNLSLNLAARATDYSVSGYVTTWKLGATYSPIPDIRVRATESSDIRAPNLSDLFQKASPAVGSIIDPLLGNANYLLRSGTTGNLQLQPEKARTTTFGVVFQPRFLQGFQGSVDFYYINISDAIGSPGAQNEVYFCYQGITQYCPAIIRNGPVVNGVAEISNVASEEYNEAAQTESGVDFDLAYSPALQALIPSFRGNLTFRLLASTYLYDILYAGIPGVAPVDSAGINGSAIGATDAPRWQYHGTVTYDYDPFSVTLTARGVSAGAYSNNFIQCTANCPPSTTNYITINNNHVAGAWYLDGNFAYTFHAGNSSQAQVFLHVSNIFNRDPPVSAFGPSGGTAFIRPAGNPLLYDLIGRQVLVGVRFTL